VTTPDVDLAVIKRLSGDYLDLPFWEGTARHELRLHGCALCGRKYWPASQCIEHGDAQMEWAPANGGGIVHTYTIMYHAYAPQMAARVPFCVAVVQLDEGPFFHTNILDCPIEDIHVGLRVEVRFQLDESTGLTLPMFVPADPVKSKT
jgi:uncharacterized OB-fold protein